MGVSYFPTSDIELAAWSGQFAAKLLAEGPSLGVSVELAQAFAQVQSRWQLAFHRATSTLTRTRGTVAAKNETRNAMKIAARRLANLVYAQADVTPEQLINLGLTVDAARSTRAAPSEPPTIRPELRDGRTVTLTITHNGGGNRRRLPEGVSGAIVFRSVGDAPPSSMSGWEFVTLTGWRTIDVFFDEETPPAAQVWFAAAWFNHRKELSPLSVPRSIYLAGGPVMSLGRTICRAA